MKLTYAISLSIKFFIQVALSSIFLSLFFDFYHLLNNLQFEPIFLLQITHARCANPVHACKRSTWIRYWSCMRICMWHWCHCRNKKSEEWRTSKRSANYYWHLSNYQLYQIEVEFQLESIMKYLVLVNWSIGMFLSG